MNYYSVGTGWANLTLQNSWTQLSGWASPQYKYQNGVVYLKGVINKSTTPTLQEVITNLPSGFRPTEQSIFTVSSSPTSGTTAGRIDIYPSGDIQFIFGVKDFLSLCGVWFFNS